VGVAAGVAVDGGSVATAALLCAGSVATAGAAVGAVCAAAPPHADARTIAAIEKVRIRVRAMCVFI
jgi:hypothetical protein